MLSISPRHDTPTIIDPSDLDSLHAESTGLGYGVVFVRVPWQELDDCSECDEGPTDPLPSTLNIAYKRNDWIFKEPVCGWMCASRKIHDLVKSRHRPDFIHVHVLEQRTGAAA